jgi:hypothetical protein
MLTQSQIAQYRYDGYLFPFPALSPEELAECNGGLSRYEAWLGKPVNEADRRWRSAGYVMLPWLDALVRHPRILDQGRRMKITAAARGAVSFRPGAGTCTHHSRLPSCVWRAHWLCWTGRGR